MSIKKLTEHITKIEGKKKPTSIAQVKEIVGIIADEIFKDLMAQNNNTFETLVKLGRSRNLKKKI